MWVLLSGGEPLLRRDFPDIYLDLRKKGLLVSLFTNATLMTPEIIALLKKYPPRELEVTVYGATAETYEKVTRNPGSYTRFINGLTLLKSAGISFTLKAMAIKSTVAEIEKIIEFSKEWTDRTFRFDPMLHLRYDRNPFRNAEIISERLSAEEVGNLEIQYPERIDAFKQMCGEPDKVKSYDQGIAPVFQCGLGHNSADVTWNGFLTGCASLRHKAHLFNLRTMSLEDAWENQLPKMFHLGSNRPEYLAECATCPLIDICMWCPAHADLEHGELDKKVTWFCQVAHKRAQLARKDTPSDG